MPAGMVPSPTGRATPYNQITAQRHNPMFGQVMNYQLGKQTNLSNEANVQTNAFAQALTSLLNNQGNQSALGGVNQAAIIERMLQGGGQGFRGGYGNLQLSGQHPQTQQSETQRAQRMATSATQAGAGKNSRTFGQVPTNEGYMRPMTEQEVLTSVITNAAAAKPNSEIKNTVSETAKVSAPATTPSGGYGVGEYTTETEASVKKKVFSDEAQRAIEVIMKRQPTIAAGVQQGTVSFEDNGDGTITMLINGSPYDTYEINKIY